MYEIGVGIVGVGVAARFQARAFAQLPGVQVTAFCGRTPQRVERIAQRFEGAVVAYNPEQLSGRDDVQLVSVTTPPGLHLAGVSAAAGLGKAVLCEKPFALDGGEAYQMLDLVQAAAVQNFVNFEFRCFPPRAQLQQLIADGYVGQVRNVHMTGANNYLHSNQGYLPDWHVRSDAGGGFLGAGGSHDVDNLRFLFGEIDSVCADLCRFKPTHAVRGSAEPAESDVDDSFAVLLRFASGASGVLANSAAAVTETVGTRIEVIGDEGTLVLSSTNKFGGPTIAGVELLGARLPETELSPIAPEHLGAFDDPHHGPFTAWAKRIVAAMRDGSELHPDFGDGYRNQLVLDAVRRSAREGRWVSTSPMANTEA